MLEKRIVLDGRHLVWTGCIIGDPETQNQWKGSLFVFSETEPCHAMLVYGLYICSTVHMHSTVDIFDYSTGREQASRSSSMVLSRMESTAQKPLHYL